MIEFFVVNKTNIIGLSLTKNTISIFLLNISLNFMLLTLLFFVIICEI